MPVTKVYPIITWENMINLVHAIMYWMFMDRPESTRQDWTTFHTISSVILEAGLMTERRMEALTSNKEFVRMVDRRILYLFPGTRNISRKKSPNARQIFQALLTQDEISEGKAIAGRLFLNMRLELTDAGWGCAESAVRSVAHILNIEQFRSAMRRLEERWPKTKWGKAAVAHNYHLKAIGILEEKKETDLS